jgi:tripeptide aminopeptidase
MARELADELRRLGLDDIVIDDHATVTAVKRGNVPGAPRIGFITHIDTVDVGLSPDIHPQILRFTGDDLCLNSEKQIWLRVAEHPEILAYPDEEIIFSDGTSVLGADNKSAVTVVMTVLENLTPEHRHGDIVVAFVPDEEVGLRGQKRWISAVLPSILPGLSTAANWARSCMRTLMPRRRRFASPA